MWTASSEQLPDAAGLRIVITRHSRAASFADVISGWQHEASFRSFLNDVVAGAPFAAFRWETPSVTPGTAMRAFQFVLLDSPGLARPPDPDAFVSQFATAKAGITVFPNLGRDAVLVVPTPIAAASAYGHLAAFVRQAPEAQRDALWRAVGDAMARRLGRLPVWLSTSGAGVSWLHVRLDDCPKYYKFAPYRNEYAQRTPGTDS